MEMKKYYMKMQLENVAKKHKTRYNNITTKINHLAKEKGYDDGTTANQSVF